MVDASWLFLMTDVDALYTANPKKDPTAKPIRVVEDLSSMKDGFIFLNLSFSFL